MSAAVSKVESLDKLVAQLDSKLNAKVSSFDTKLDVILLSLSKVKKPGPSDEERDQQLDQLIPYDSSTPLRRLKKSITQVLITISKPSPPC